MRPKKVVTYVMLSLMVLFIYYSTNAAPLISDEKYNYIGGMEWYKTYDEGSKIALEENKPLLVYFWAIWCQFCERLNTEVYANPEVSKVLTEDFVLVAVDLDANNEDANRFEVQYPPHLIFLTSTGEIITRIPGYVSKEDLLFVLEGVKEMQRAGPETNLQEVLPQTKKSLT